MPTPFTHLAMVDRLLNDAVVPPGVAVQLRNHLGAFLLGSVAPDAHHTAPGLKREDTHFFEYAPKIDPPATTAMLSRYPELMMNRLTDPAHRVFVAGYLGHLAVDVLWSEQAVIPIWTADWGDPPLRHFLFVTLISVMDGRDYQRIPAEFHPILAASWPAAWLPFLPDHAMIAWRDQIASQIAPEGEPLSLQIMGRTTAYGYEGLVAMLNDPERLEHELWSRFSMERLAVIEAALYERMRATICTYLEP